MTRYRPNGLGERKKRRKLLRDVRAVINRERKRERLMTF
jgi:hypothetical protein